MPKVPALRRWKQEDEKSKVTLGYIVGFRLYKIVLKTKPGSFLGILTENKDSAKTKRQNNNNNNKRGPGQ